MCQFITDTSLEEVFTNCKGLKVLSIHNCTLVTGSSFHLIHNCKSLEVLDASYCPKFSDDALQLVSEYCPSLSHLDVSGCSCIADDGLSSIVQHCDSIETLRAVLCDQAMLTKHSLGVLTRFGKSLHVLELTGVVQLDDDCVTGIAKHGQALELLALNGCVNITDRAIRAVIEGCVNLRCCEICSCKNVTLNALIDMVYTLKHLHKLVISECNISDVELDILRKTTNRCTVIKQGTNNKPQTYLVTYTAPKEKGGKKKKKGGKKKKKK